MAKIKKKSLDKGKKSFIAWMVVVGVLLISSYAAFMAIRSKPRHLTPPHPPLTKGGQEGVVKVVDPVCGMDVTPPAEGHTEYRAKHYFFCSKVCKDEFEKEPGKYIKESPSYMKGGEN